MPAFHPGVTSLNCSPLKDGHWVKWFWYVGKEAGRNIGWEFGASFLLCAGKGTQSSDNGVGCDLHAAIQYLQLI